MRSLNLIGALALSTLSVQALAQQSREAAQPAKPKRQTKAEKKAAKRARTAGVQETFWLIERGANQGQSPTMWWSSKPDAVSTYSWVESVHEATRFDSAAAAEAMAQAQYITRYAVTSHNYMDGGQR